MYIYGIVPATYNIADRFREMGLLNVFGISCGMVSAVVAQQRVVDYTLLGTEQLAKLLIDHQKTVEVIMSMGIKTFVPMRIGTFAANEDEVVRILRKGYDLALELLKKVESTLEVNLISSWADFSSVLQRLAANPLVVTMKSQIAEREVVTQSDQLSIGYLIKRLLDEEKMVYAGRISDALSPICISIKQHDIPHEKVISNTAFLIKSSNLTLFEEVLDRLDAELDGKVSFKLVSPLPCYSFYTLEVKELHSKEIEEARRELELSSEMSARSVKHAYHERMKKVHPDTSVDGDTMVVSKVNMAFQTMMDCLRSMKPSSYEKLFPLSSDKVGKDSFVLKIKE